jgi:hypothetical protein
MSYYHRAKGRSGSSGGDFRWDSVLLFGDMMGRHRNYERVRHLRRLERHHKCHLSMNQVRKSIGAQSGNRLL